MGEVVSDGGLEPSFPCRNLVWRDWLEESITVLVSSVESYHTSDRHEFVCFGGKLGEFSNYNATYIGTSKFGTAKVHGPMASSCT
jgi:hypothetical protein